MWAGLAAVWLLACGGVDGGDDPAGAGGVGSGGDGGTAAGTGGDAVGGRGGSLPCLDYTDEGLFVPGGVSFAADVMPIFQASCSSSSCHGTSADTPKAELVLGPPPGNVPTADELAAAHAELVGADAMFATMKRVAGGDPAGSWLLLKVESALPTTTICLPDGVTCGVSGCGKKMPAGIGATPLDEQELSVLRTWIRDGAAND